MVIQTVMTVKIEQGCREHLVGFTTLGDFVRRDEVPQMFLAAGDEGLSHSLTLTMTTGTTLYR